MSRQGFPLYNVTIWVEDLGVNPLEGQHYRVWYSHNLGTHIRYRECVTKDPVAATQACREEVLKIYARDPRHTAADVRALRTEKYTTWVQILFQMVIPLGVLLVCLVQAPWVCLFLVFALLYVNFT